MTAPVARGEGASSRRAMLASGVVAAAARAAWVAAHDPSKHLGEDPGAYLDQGRHLLSGQATAHDTLLPLGWSLVVAGTERWTGGLGLLAIVNVLAGAATAALAVPLATRLGAGPRAAWAAGLATALFPPLVHMAGYLLPETVCGALVAATTLLTARLLERASLRDALALGALLGVGAALRSNVLAIAGLTAALAAALALAPAWRARAAHLGVAVLVASAPIALVMAHQSRLVGRRAGLDTHGASNLYMSLSPLDPPTLWFPCAQGAAPDAPLAPLDPYEPPSGCMDTFVVIRNKAAWEAEALAEEARIVAAQRAKGRSLRKEESAWLVWKKLGPRIGKRFDAPAYVEDRIVRQLRVELADEPASRVVRRALSHLASGLGAGPVDYWPAEASRLAVLRASRWAWVALAVVPALLASAFRLASMLRRRAVDAPLLAVLLAPATLLPTLLLFADEPRMTLPFVAPVVALAASFASLLFRRRASAARPGTS